MPTCSFFGWKSMKTKLGMSLPNSIWVKDSATGQVGMKNAFNS